MNTGLIKDLETKLGTGELFRWIDGEAERLGSLGRGHNNIVYFSNALMRARNVVKIAPSTMIGSASIVPRNGRYLILVNRKLPLLPQRFAIAHEFGHTYWFAPGGEGRPLSPLQWSLGRDPDIENLCNRFAAALLLPRGEMVNSIATPESKEPNIEMCLGKIPALAKKFLVAEQLVARRLFFEILQLRIVIICCRRPPIQVGAEVQKQSWSLSWCALPNGTNDVLEGFAIPAKSSGRRVPTEMIPGHQPLGPSVQLNGKWWLAVKPTPVQEASRPFRKWPEQPTRVGHFFSTENKIYIALPLI